MFHVKHIKKVIATTLVSASLIAGSAVIAPAASASTMTACYNVTNPGHWQYLGGRWFFIGPSHGAEEYIDYNWWEEVWGATDGWQYFHNVYCA